MADKLLLGELLSRQKLVDRDTIGEALRVQVGGNRRLGNILVRMGVISEDQLVDVLAAQLGIEITAIKAAFTPEVRKILPRYLCKKYDVIPLRLKNHNILEIAMSDPSDQQAITDLEQYTGKVIEARLAKQSEIASSITTFIPYSVNDFFSPESNTRFTRVAVAVCLILTVLVGGFTYRYIRYATYGTISDTEESTIYKNHNLMLGFDTKGKITLLGRGAFADGYYSVVFNDEAELRSFLTKRAADFADNQRDWLTWAINRAAARGVPDTVTSTR